MADRNEKYRQKYLETVSAHIGQPVEAVGVFSRPGSMGSAMLSQLSPLASMVKNRAGKSKAGGLPQNVIIGVTADKVWVFDFKPKGTSIKLKGDPRAVFERSGVRAEVVGEGKMATRVRFHLPDGDSIELDSNRMPGSANDFNAPVVEALAGTSA